MHFGVLATILGLSWSVVWHFNKSVYKKVRMINNGTVYACILALSSIVSLFLSFINVFHADAYSNLDPLGIIWQIGFYLISTVLVHEAPRF